MRGCMYGMDASRTVVLATRPDALLTIVRPLPC
jgi:hypothetical protein